APAPGALSGREPVGAGRTAPEAWTRRPQANVNVAYWSCSGLQENRTATRGRTAMATEPITMELDEAAARVFRNASPEERRKLEALVSLQLLEAMTPTLSLRELMDEISQRAQERGLTEELLQEILKEADEVDRAR